MKNLLTNTLIFFAFLVSPNPVFASPPSQLISKSEKQLLTGLNIPILLPAYIPSGFFLKKIDAVVEKLSGPGVGNRYTVTYMKNLPNGNILQFAIETTPGGIGDLMQSKPVSVKTKFGLTDIYIDSVIENSKTRLNNCIDMEWLSYKNNFYRFSSGGCSPGADNSESIKRVTKEEAIKIISSLQVIK